MRVSQRIYEYLVQHGATNQRDLAAALNLHRKTVAYATGVLLRYGLATVHKPLRDARLTYFTAVVPQ